MEVTKDLVKKIASNARLNLSDDEVQTLLPQLKEILATFSDLDKIDTKDAKPSFHPIEIKNVLREDITGKCLSNEEALSLTGHKKNGYFRGPKAL